MKRSLLSLTQSILSSLGSDEVNSIGDTTESLQVAEVIRTTYFNIISRMDPGVQQQLVQLNPSLDETVPVLMYVPDGVKKVEWLKYFDNNILPDSADVGFQHDLNLDITPSGSSTGTIPGYKYVTILPVTQFVEMTNSFNPDNDNVFSFIFTDSNNGFPGTYTFYYKNNKTPQYCTILSDYYVIFDGYDSVVDDTLQASKTMAYGEVIPVFLMEDGFIPNLDETTFPLLLNEAKSLAFVELKQVVHTKAERESKRGWSSVQRNKNVIERPTSFDALPDFGRRRVGHTSYFKSRGWDR